MKQFIILLLITLITSSAFAGPFGLKFGATLSELKEITNIELTDEGRYRGTVVPKPYKKFSEYFFMIDDYYGLVRVMASTGIYDDNSFGSETQEKFKALKEALTNKYGKPKDYDSLRNGSIWSRDNDWLTGLLKKERILSAAWTSDFGFTPTGGISSILLKAKGVSPQVAGIILRYSGDDYIKVLEKQKKESQKAL